MLNVPPSVPRSIKSVPSHNTACLTPLGVAAYPTTWPALLMELAMLSEPPNEAKYVAPFSLLQMAACG